MKSEFIDFCRDLIAIDSSPLSGTMEIAHFISKKCQEQGLCSSLQQERKDGLDQANVIVRLDKDSNKEELLLLSHLDTADPGNRRSWKETGFNPFNATVIGDKIYGLGVVDAKLDLACKIQALVDLKNQGLTASGLNPVIVGTYGQELGLLGASKLLRKKLVSPNKVIVGDPSNLTLCCAGKGMATVEIRIPFSQEEINYRRDHDVLESTSSQTKLFSGKSGHSSNPLDGDNAIDKLFSYLFKMPDGLMIMEMEGGVNPQTIAATALLEVDIVGGIGDSIIPKILKVYEKIREIEKDFVHYPDHRFEPSITTLNFGTLRTYEDHILLCGTCLLPPSVEDKVYKAWMKGISDICQEVTGSFRIKNYNEPFYLDEKISFIESCLTQMKEVGLQPETSFNASCSEVSIFHKMGVDCVSFGPGVRRGNSHSASENVKIQDLYKAIDFYKRILLEFCFKELS